MRIKFSIPMLVQPKQGDQSHVVTAKNGKHFVAHHKAPKVVKNAEYLAGVISGHIPLGALSGPLRMDVMVYYPWRKAERKKVVADGYAMKDTKPDHDNLNKQLCDVMEALRFFANDAQLADVRIRKFWTGKVGVDVVLETIEPGDRKSFPGAEWWV